jgi:uncharacterized protein DUF6232
MGNNAYSPMKGAKGDYVAGQVIFQTDRISITPTIAKFDGVSYQVANIGSVRVVINGLWHPAAVVLLLVWAVCWIIAFNNVGVGKEGEYFFAGLIFGMIGGVWQRWWPRKEFVLLLKTSSGDVQAYKTTNRDHILDVKHSLDEAFNARQ